MRVLYDHQAFVMQRHGGISHYFSALMKTCHEECGLDVALGLARCENAHILETDFFSPQIVLAPQNPVAQAAKKLFRGTMRAFAPARLRHDSNVSLSLRMIKAQDYDVFHPTYYSDYWLGEGITKPVVLTVFDMIHEIYAEQLGLDNLPLSNKPTMTAAASKLIAISETTKKDVVALLGIDPAKVDVVYLAPFADPAKANAKVSLPERYILYTGARWQYKNFPLFARAFAQVSREQADVYLVVAGGGEFSASERVYMQRLGIEDRVVKVDGTDEVINTALKHAAVFGYPSLYEGFGIPILDAWLFNVPVICSNNAVFKEIAEDCVTYFEPKQLDSIVEAMRTALGDKEATRTRVERGFRKVADFSRQKLARKTLEVYRSVT